jgi:hypothetical protein
MQNFVEELIAELYQSKGYFVTKNFWVPFQSTRQRTQKGKDQSYDAQSWTDIDILAKNDKELVIIQVKAIINDKKVAEKIKLYFQRIEDFLKRGLAPDDRTDISWWTKNVDVKKIVIYEWENSPKAYINLIKEGGIEVYPFREYFDKLIEYVNNKKGVKEENAALRLLHFLKTQDLIKSDEKKTKEKSK